VSEALSTQEDQTARERVDVVVVGAGQAGLVMGYFLARAGSSFVILDAADSVGSAWRNRWDSLVLFTPRRYSALAGMPFTGDPDTYPTRDEVIAYLEEYATRFNLRLELNARVRSVHVVENGFVVDATGRQFTADTVVVATGPFQQPNVPEIAEQLSPAVVQMHSTEYKNPNDLPNGVVLVVGGGNTGFQIAEELSGSREVHLAIGTRQTPLPQRLMGRDLFWWLTKTGLIRRSVETRIGRRASQRDTLIGSSPRRARRHGVRVRPRAVTASDKTVTFADDTSLAIDAVVWATGFRLGFTWLDVPVLASDGRPIHRRGVTDVPGLYFLGLSWLHTRGSGLIGFVRDDAEYLAGRIMERAARKS
jgi:putative flavoprotein involved in K+ transport